MVEYILFKHPDLKMRKEEFGGIIKTKKGLYLLDKETYNLLNNLNITIYSELSKDKKLRSLINELLKMEIILKIEKNKADKLKKEYEKSR